MFTSANLFYPDYDRIIKNIERGEARISRRDEIMKAIGKKLDRYKNPWLELKIQYGQNKGKLYNEECDRFMVRFFIQLMILFIIFAPTLASICSNFGKISCFFHSIQICMVNKLALNPHLQLCPFLGSCVRIDFL